MTAWKNTAARDDRRGTGEATACDELQNCNWSARSRPVRCLAICTVCWEFEKTESDNQNLKVPN